MASGVRSQELWRALPELLPGLWLAAWTAEANDYGETDEYGDPHDVAYRAKVKNRLPSPSARISPAHRRPTHSRLLCAVHPAPVRWSTTAERPWACWAKYPKRSKN